MMEETHLSGLEGTNPLGFLAALGVQTAFAGEDEQPCLRWSEDVTPHAVVNHGFSVERITEQALAVAACWKDSPALNPARPDGARMPKGDELKLSPDDITAYLRRRGPIESGGGLATALLAEDSLDNQGVAKPSDLYFTAGQMKFLGMARTILSKVGREEMVEGLVGPWNYASHLPSLGWDVVDDRVYALRANNPAPDKKLTNPGCGNASHLGTKSPSGVRRARTNAHARMFRCVEIRPLLLAALAQSRYAECSQVTSSPCLWWCGGESTSLVRFMGRLHHPQVADPPVLTRWLRHIRTTGGHVARFLTDWEDMWLAYVHDPFDKALPRAEPRVAGQPVDVRAPLQAGSPGLHCLRGSHAH